MRLLLVGTKNYTFIYLLILVYMSLRIVETKCISSRRVQQVSKRSSCGEEFLLTCSSYLFDNCGSELCRS